MTLSVREILEQWDLCEDEIEQSLGSFMDGWWSTQTRSAVRDLGASALDLNEGWAATPASWSCPVCQRKKRDLFRVNQQGVAIAHLVTHHDHVEEYIVAWKRKLRDSGNDEVISESGYFRSAVHDLVIRFLPILICEDCNNADAKAKSWLEGNDEFFSFSPAEIAGFISPASHKVHELDKQAVLMTFQEALPKHKARMAMLDQLLAMVSAGSAWIALADGRMRHSGCRLEWRKRNENSLMRHFSGIAHGDSYRLLRFSCKNEGLGRGKKTALSEATRIPTETEFRSYTPQSFLWDKCGDDWCCAVCKRSKFEIMRWNLKKRKWAGNIVGGTAIAGQSVVSGSSEAERMARTVCEDCNNVNSRLSWDWRLNADEIRAIATFAPHKIHQLDLSRLSRAMEYENWDEDD